jgi:ubiquinone/menaquinone biosynthesis C-methylase UbiE
MSDRYAEASAAGYDRGFGSISSQFVPALLQAARVNLGHRVLDVATGTGVAAEAAAKVIGAQGQVMATDMSSAMLDRARGRLCRRSNVSFSVEDGQRLSFPDNEFDAVLCAMGLMLFADPVRGLMEFRRVLRKGGWAAVSVSTMPERSFAIRVDATIGLYVPEYSVTAARFFSLGDAELLRSFLARAGFREVETFTESWHFPFVSFTEYFKPFEEGHGPTGQALVALPASIQQAVREDVGRQLEGGATAGGSIDVEVAVLFGCGRK